jgi:hypothetical protein
MTSWLDLGNLQNLLEMMRNKVANSERNAFEGPILDQILQNGP